MLELLITYIKLTFQNSMPEITEVQGLAEIIRQDDKQFPAFYCTNDEYKPVSDFENFLYFRQTGPISEEESEEGAVSGCDRLITQTYPMVAVAYVPKDIYNTDNAFIDGKVGQNIANIIKRAAWQSLSPALKTDLIYVEVNDINTDRYAVWENEYTNVAFAARLDHVYVSVEFDIIVTATESCLRNYDCNDAVIVVDGNTITIIIECNNPMATIFEAPNVNFVIVDARLIGGTLEKLFLFMGGTEQIGIGNVANYNAFTGTITFVSDLGGNPVKVQLFP